MKIHATSNQFLILLNLKDWKSKDKELPTPQLEGDEKVPSMPPLQEDEK